MDGYKQIVEKWYREQEVVGVGTGRTVKEIMRHLGPLLAASSSKVVGTSITTNLLLASHGVTPSMMECVSKIDLYFDGADYVDDEGYIVKGHGGAISLERIAIYSSATTILVVQKSKRVKTLDGLFVPVELLKECLSIFISHLCARGARYKIKTTEHSAVYVTDNRNIIVDIEYNRNLLKELERIPGVVSHGFIEPAQNIKVYVVDRDVDGGEDSGERKEAE